MPGGYKCLEAEVRFTHGYKCVSRLDWMMFGRILCSIESETGMQRWGRGVRGHSLTC